MHICAAGGWAEDHPALDGASIGIPSQFLTSSGYKRSKYNFFANINLLPAHVVGCYEYTSQRPLGIKPVLMVDACKLQSRSMEQEKTCSCQLINSICKCPTALCPPVPGFLSRGNDSVGEEGEETKTKHRSKGR